MRSQGKLYTFSATGFLYSLIIVDLYRKLVGTSVEGIRNAVYIFFFALLFLDMCRSRRMKPMLIIAGVTMALFGFSILINPGYSAVYTSSIILFISRLWPAYYIGRYTEDWDSLSKSVLLFSPIALIYAVCLFVIPEFAGGQAYATIASNLAFVSMISLFASIKLRTKKGLLIAIICLLPVLFYGTRSFFLGAIISLFLAYLLSSNNGSSAKRAFLIFILFLVAIVFLIFNDAIFNQLYSWFPNSRTLKMMAVGDFLDDSNRGLFYNKILSHLEERPFSMLGLIGDRIYLSSSSATTTEILSEFSHNCCLELCMDFGLPLGVILNLHFIKKLVLAVKKSFSNHQTIHYIFVLIFGAGLLDMMVSASFMGSYIPWLLFGLALCIGQSR